MSLSIIYIVLSTAIAWQTQAILQVQNKKQMQVYLELNQLDNQCVEESSYLLFPVSCSLALKSLAKLGFINSHQANLRTIELERKCSESLVKEIDVRRLLLLENRVDSSTKCKAKIEERIKDLLYSQS